MERLTNKEEGDAQRQDYENRLKNGYPRNIPEERFLKLAAYEDTGLTPEEIVGMCSMSERAKMADLLRLEEYQAIGTINHLQELAQAEKDGRLVVLPCKLGDTFWSFYNYPATGICRIVVTEVSTLDGITVINTDNYGVIPEKDIGKTVFLTREEAEAALKKREAENG